MKRYINDLKTKIPQMENLQSSIETQIRGERIKYLGFNPVELERSLITSRQLLNDMEKEYALVQGFQLSTEYVEQKPVRPKIITNIALAAIASLILSFLVAVLLDGSESRRR